MAKSDDIPKTDPSEIEALVQRLKQSNLEPRDVQSVERLLCRPRRCRISSYIEVHNPSAMMRQDHQDEQHAKRSGRDGKKIDSDNIAEVIVKKCPPGY